MAMHLKKIVIAEDDDAIAHMVNMALGDAGYLCLRARDGQEALNLVRKHTPDLLVLDVMMPRMDGIEVTKTLRGDVILSKTPIMMLTALSDIDQKVKGFDAGADDYVTKPFDLRELSARVGALIRAARRERERSPATGLPGSSAIEGQLDDLMGKGGGGASVLHLDVRDFDSYADEVGFAAAQELVKTLGEQVVVRVDELGGRCGFVGHLGGTDFIVLTDRDKAVPVAEALIADFEANRSTWLTIEAANAALVVGIVAIGSATSPSGGGALKRRLAAALREAKQGQGSGYVVSNAE